MAKKTVVARLASLLEARANCEKSGNGEWFGRHTEAIVALAREHLPSGSGIDSGCTVVLSTPADRVCINVPFHCMNPDGYYDGWRDYMVTARPAFDGITVTVTGRDYNGTKDYLGELFHEVLTREIDG